MRKTTQNPTTKRSTSIFVRIFQNRKRNFLGRRNTPQDFDFVKENKGSITSSTVTPGIIKVVFYSRATGRKAFAFGPTLGDAYQNMIKKYNLKYA